MTPIEPINLNTAQTLYKTVLLNPPGDKMILRDYYCAKVSKARYYYHPVDFIYLSGRLAALGELMVIDAIASQLSAEETLDKISRFEPSAVIFLSSAPSFVADMAFMQRLSVQLPHTQIIGTGDVFRDYGKEAMIRYPFMHAVFIDFSTDDIIRTLTHQSGVINNVIYRKNNELIAGTELHGNGVFDVPLPRWDLFDISAYRFPFARRKPFASILTDFGCPFSCDFCPVSSLGFKLRSIDSVIEEMTLLSQMGVKELYIRDQTFGANRKRTVALLNAMLDKSLKFSWTGLSRADILDVELVKLMKKAGCHTLMIGIESANDNLMAVHKKNTRVSEVSEKISQIRSTGVRVGGFFMIGFPGESKESVLNTIRLALSLKVDYASFNIATPRLGTHFRRHAIEQGLVQSENIDAESSSAMPVWQNQQLSNNELFNLRRMAVRKFYLRPLYLLKRFAGIRTLNELSNLINEGFALLSKTR